MSRANPLVLKIGLWMLVLAWAACVAFHWLGDASATPPPTVAARPRPVVDLESAIAQAATAPVFGETGESEAVPTPGAAPLDIKLKGVFAGGGGPVAAIVDTGGEEDELVMLGAQIRPGVVLQGVYPTYIVIAREGGSHRVELEPVKSDASRSKAAQRTSGARPAHTRPAAPEALEPEAAAAPAEPESSKPLAPPMPQSDAGPLSRVA
jgi:type II secretory pathway component PulC